jgi:cation transport regulator ChaB
MSFYWIYDLPTWKFGLGTILLFILISAGGLSLTRTRIYNKFRISEGTNETVNGFFAGIGVIYGLLVGLVAVAAWDNYQSVDAIAGQESASIAALYRDISTLEQPAKGQLQGHLRDYLNFVINVAWPAHKHGERPRDGSRMLSRFHAVLAVYHPRNVEQQTLQAEALTAFNKLIEARRARLAAIDTGIPAVFWFAILGGTFATIFIAYFFHVSSRRLHLLLTGTFGGFVGCVVFLVAAVDNPFRGEVSISSEAYVQLANTLSDLDPSAQQSPVP